MLSFIGHKRGFNIKAFLIPAVVFDNEIGWLLKLQFPHDIFKKFATC